MPRFIPPSRLQVWAVEDTSVQLTWGELPPGEVVARTGDLHAAVIHPGGPGALDVTGLAAGRDHHIDVSWDGGRAQLSTTTLDPPPGELLAKVATVSDLHLGARRWGASKLMRDRSDHADPFPFRCARACLQEATAWGAELLLVKGDAAHHQRTADYEQVGRLLDTFPDLPVLLIPGNHEVDGRTDDPMPTKVGVRGVPYLRQPTCTDLPGIRVIVADTTVPGRGSGSVDGRVDEIVELASLSSQPFLLGLHHQLQPHRLPDHYPPGVAAPSSIHLLDELAAANPHGLVTSGHTHRNRNRRHGPLMVTEVASTRDWPGVWAGYAVHEHGIRQVVRRAAADDAIGWTEYSRRALLGLWGWWAAGPLEQRCFSHRWDRR